MAQQSRGILSRLFGFNIGDQEADSREIEKLQEIVPKESNDGSATILGGGVFGTYLDLEGTAKTESALITRYRQMALYPECERAVDSVVNEVIVNNNRQEDIVDIAFHDLYLDEKTFSQQKIPNKVKTKIRTEFQHILRLLDFKFTAYELFKRWYVDGKIYYHILIDAQKPTEGIKELRFVDPLKIKKVRELEANITPEQVEQALSVGKLPQPKYNEYFVFSPAGFLGARAPGQQGTYGHTPQQGSMPKNYVKIAPDSIVYTPSGLMDETRTQVLGYLHKAIRPLNLLRLVEDALIIYRISRAPERRVFYVDIGSMPRNRGQQYINQLIAQYRNKLVYDAKTGEMKDDRRYQTMLEDYWLPRQEGSKGTEVSTLPGGQNLGQIEDVEFLQRKLYESLNVPLSRLQPDQSTFGFGRMGEITRDEIMFKKFIDRLRLKFSQMFYELLKRQLLLKNIIAEEDWKKIREEIFFQWKSDVHYEELKDAELLQNRFQVLQMAEAYIGKYISHDFVRKNILMQTDQERVDIDSQIKKENESGQYNTPEDDGY